MRTSTFAIIGLSVLLTGTCQAQAQRRQPGNDPRQYDTTNPRQPGSTMRTYTTTRTFGGQSGQGIAAGYNRVI